MTATIGLDISPVAPVTFILDGRLPGMNEVIAANRSHRQKGADLKRDTEDGVMWAMKAQRVKPVPSPVRVCIVWYEPSMRRDPDNIFSAVKFILDAMVKGGILEGDSQRHIRAITHECALDRKRPRVEVTLWGVGA